MFKIIQPSSIIFGKHSAREYSFPENCLVITSKGAISRGWLEYLKLKDFSIFDEVEPNPSIETTEKILSQFKNADFSSVIGLGGGSSLDVAKFAAYKMNKKKILIPTTFGSGSEVTKISVLNIKGKKTSFHDEKILADVAIVDSFFVKDTPREIIKNSAIDSCAQCSEAYDSKLSNVYTKFLCKTAFNILEDALLHDKLEKLAFGSLLTGLGFGNSSTTLGHALSYIFSNEGYNHGHALAFTTLAAHRFNSSIFTKRFERITEKLEFEKIYLKQDLITASKIIFSDRKHLDNNPKIVSEENIIEILKQFKI